MKEIKLFLQRAFNVVYLENTMKQFKLILFSTILGAVLLFVGSASFVDAAPTSTPTPSSPGNGSTTVIEPVTLRWSGVTFNAAGGYILKISGGILGAAGRKEWIPSTSTSYTVLETLLVEDEHIWTVQACYGFNISAVDCGPLSSASNFFPVLAKAQLDYPGNNDFVSPDEDGTITLQWIEVPGADRYSVMLSKDSGTPFSITFDKSNSNITTTSFKILANLIELNRFYTWQVTPIQGDTLGPLSGPEKFFVSLSKPVLVAPEKDAIEIIASLGNISANVKFEWNKVVGAEEYNLELFGNTDLKPAGTSDLVVETFVFKIGTYEWQVTACEAELVNCGLSSERRKFTVRNDTTNPGIEMFTVEPDEPAWLSSDNSNLTISWKVSDQGGTDINRVEIWKAEFDEENCKTGGDKNSQEKETCGWEKISEKLSKAIAPLGKDSWSDSIFIPSPSKTSWYGLHVYDWANNKTTERDAGKKPIKVQVDKILPTINKFEKTNPPGNDFVNIKNRIVTFEYEVADSISGMKTIELWRKPNKDNKDELGKVDSNTGSGESIFTDKLPLGIEETHYKYGLHVFDQAGNKCTDGDANCRKKGAFVRSFIVDTRAPTKPGIPTTPSTSDQTPTWTWEASQGNPTSYTVFWDTTVRGEANSESVTINSFTHVDGLDEGTWFVKVKAFDAVGNPSAFSKNGSVAIDISGGSSSSDGSGDFDQYSDGEDDLGGIPFVNDDPRGPSTPGQCSGFCSTLGTDNPQDAPDGITCICNPLRSTNIADIIKNIVTLLFNFALVLTPVMVVVSGIMFVTAAGDPGRISTAKSILLWTAVGLVIIILSRGLVAVLATIIGF